MFDLAKNYFELFGLPVGFIIDGAELVGRYRELQRVVHPDRYANATEQEQRLSLQQTTRINEAFETLKNPVTRAQYLLSLHGIDMQAEKETTRNTAFLMEQLQLREELENARYAEHPEDVLDELMGRISAMIRTLVAQMAIKFEDPSPPNLEAARETVRKMQFLNKLLSEAESLEAELEDMY